MGNKIEVCNEFREFTYEELRRDNNLISGDGECPGCRDVLNRYFQGCMNLNCEYRRGTQ